MEAVRDPVAGPLPNMSRPVAALGGLVIVMGLWIAVFPQHLMSVADWESRAGLYIAASIRIVTGLFLIFNASATRYPRGLKIFGGLVLLAGLILPFVPLELWTGLIRWWFVEQRVAMRFGAGVGGVLLGGFLVYASVPEKHTGGV